MFPIALDLTVVPVILVGNGEKTLRRLTLLEQCGAGKLRVFSEQPSDALRAQAGDRLVEHLPEQADLASAQVLMVVDVAEDKASALARLARQQHILVNVEDNKPYCDFHFPSFIKRGDLLLAVSSGGKSPSLSRAITRWLAGIFDESWAAKLAELAKKRECWQQEGKNYDEIKAQSEAWIETQQWLNK